MIMEQIGLVFSIVTGLVSLGSVLYLSGVKIATLTSEVGKMKGLDTSVARIEVKVDTMWEFMIRRSKVELIRSGLGEMGSDVKLTESGFEAILPYLPTFLDFYRELSNGELAQNEMYMEFGRRFGDLIMAQIAVPLGLTIGQCVIAAVKACEIECGVEDRPKSWRFPDEVGAS